jgi:U2 small nuclear ribonucleoprotein A'
LETLVLTHNRIASLREVDALARGFRESLVSLSLLHNPVTRRSHYRLFAVFRFPRLRFLDFQRVTRKERVAALRLFAGKAGHKALAEIQALEAESGPKDGPAGGLSLPTGSQSRSLPASGAGGGGVFSASELALIQGAIQAASTAAEIEELEQCLREGRLPALLAAQAAGAAGAAAKTTVVEEAPVPLGL